jgi:hypothetical protein
MIKKIRAVRKHEFLGNDVMIVAGVGASFVASLLSPNSYAAGY